MIAQSEEAERAKARAEARFRRQRENEIAAEAGRHAANAKTSAERDKTARLRALRLAKEEADRVEAVSNPVAPKKARKPAAKPALKARKAIA